MQNSNEHKARRIATLLAGYMRDTLTEHEHDELDEWVGASDKNMRLFEELTDENRVKLALELLNTPSGNHYNDTVLQELNEHPDDFYYPEKKPNKILQFAFVMLTIAIIYIVNHL